jgi:hypothetical protein
VGWVGVLSITIFNSPCPMHLVTVEVKVDSSLLIKIVVSIKVILVLVEGFSLLQKINIKLPSIFVQRRKEVKMVLYFVPALTEFYQVVMYFKTSYRAYGI